MILEPNQMRRLETGLRNLGFTLHQVRALLPLRPGAQPGADPDSRLSADPATARLSGRRPSRADIISGVFVWAPRAASGRAI